MTDMANISNPRILPFNGASKSKEIKLLKFSGKLVEFVLTCNAHNLFLIIVVGFLLGFFVLFSF